MKRSGMVWLSALLLMLILSSSFLLPNMISSFSWSGGNTGFEPWYYYIGGMVNSATGNLYFTARDISFKARGFDIEIVRAYNSHRNATSTGFGYGWTLNYHVYLVENGAVVSLIEGDGSVHDFTSVGGGRYSPPPGVHSRLIKNVDGSFTLWFKDGSKYNFSSVGRLLNISDKNGNHLTFSYADGKLTRVEDDSSLALILSYNALNRISSVVDPLSRQIRYEYDICGNLIKVIDAMGYFTLYFYNADHTLKSIVNRCGGMFESNYSNGKVAEIWNGLYDYSLGLPSLSFRTYSIRYDVQNATATNSMGFNTTIQMNDAGNPTRIVDSSGNATTMSWDSDMNKIAFTNANGHSYIYKYDAFGNLLNETDPLGFSTFYEWNNTDGNDQFISLLTSKRNARSFVTSFSYDAKGNLILITDATGNSSHLDYDAYGYVVRKRNFRGYETSYSYDTRGNVICLTDATGNITTYTYDIVGRLISVTDPNEHMTSYQYDNDDRLVNLTDAHGGLTRFFYNEEGSLIRKVDANGHEAVYSHNFRNRLERVKDASGNQTSYLYDKEGNLLSSTNAKGGITQTKYDELDRVIQLEDALGNQQRYSYDAVGNKISETDKRGHTTFFEYDALNRLKKITDPLGSETKYEYDEVGELVLVIDAKNHTISLQRDQLSRIIEITDSLGCARSLSYDADGNKIAYTDAKGQISRYEYDALGRLVKVIDPTGGVSTFSYDGVGNIIAFTDKNGHTRQYYYDALNRLVQFKDPLGHTSSLSYDTVGNVVEAANARGYSTRYYYDNLDRLVKTKDALNYTCLYEYDALGNLISETDGNGNTVRYAYDLLNRLIRKTDALGKHTQYRYDEVGNVVSAIDASNYETKYEYDALNRLIKVTDATNNATSFAYDVLGNLLNITDAHGHTTRFEYDELNRRRRVTSPRGYQTEYFYDSLGNIIKRIDANGGTTIYDYDERGHLLLTSYDDGSNVTYSYDSEGNVVKIENTGGLRETTYYSYDEFNRLISVTIDYGFSNKTITYAYDEVGNTKTMTDPNGGVTTYEYDALNRLVRITDPFGNFTTYEYDGGGRVVRTTYPNNVYTICWYDKANRLVNLTTKDYQNTTLFDYAYEYDNAGNRVSMTEDDAYTTLYEYDALHRLVYVTYPSGTRVKYEYDAVGNRVIQKTNGNVTVYTYDADDRLVAAGDVTYAYDNNGNLIVKTAGNVTTYYEFDYENRLTAAILPTQNIAFKYAPTGSRLGKIAGTDTTIYFYDSEDILLEYDETGSQKARYTHGPGMDAPVSVNRNGSVHYYHFDGLGNVDSLISSNGNIDITYQYDAFGTIVNKTGTVRNFYTFTSREIDEEIALYYYRARYYDSHAGRFLSKDPVGVLDGVNLYTYAKNNPINLIDPLGLEDYPIFGGKVEGVDIGKEVFDLSKYDQKCIKKHFEKYRESFENSGKLHEQWRNALANFRKSEIALQSKLSENTLDLVTAGVGIVVGILGVITGNPIVALNGLLLTAECFVLKGAGPEEWVPAGYIEAASKPISEVLQKVVSGASALGSVCDSIGALLKRGAYKEAKDKLKQAIRELEAIDAVKMVIDSAKQAWSDFLKAVESECFIKPKPPPTPDPISGPQQEGLLPPPIRKPTPVITPGPGEGTNGGKYHGSIDLIRDVAVTDLRADASTIYTTIYNPGDCKVTTSLSIHYGRIGDPPVTLLPGTSTQITEGWSPTTGLWQITAEASPVLGETNTADNTRTIQIRISYTGSSQSNPPILNWAILAFGLISAVWIIPSKKRRKQAIQWSRYIITLQWVNPTIDLFTSSLMTVPAPSNNRPNYNNTTTASAYHSPNSGDSVWHNPTNRPLI